MDLEESSDSDDCLDESVGSTVPQALRKMNRCREMDMDIQLNGRGVLENIFNFIKYKYMRHKTWKDIKRQILDGCMSTVQANELLQSFYTLIEEIANAHPDYVDSVAAFVFCMYFSHKNGYTRKGLIQYAFQDVTSSDIHNILTSIRKIEEILPFHVRVSFQECHDKEVVEVSGVYTTGLKKLPLSRVYNPFSEFSNCPNDSFLNFHRYGYHNTNNTLVSNNQQSDTHAEDTKLSVADANGKMFIEHVDLEDHEVIYFSSSQMDMEAANLNICKEFEIPLGSSLLINLPVGYSKLNVILSCVKKLYSTLESSDISLFSTKPKVVYLISSDSGAKNLAEFLNKSSSLNVVSYHFSSLCDFTEENLLKSDVLITSPQMWELFTRKLGYEHTVDNIRLLWVDDISEIGKSEGALLEAVILRMRNMVLYHEKLQVVAFLTSLVPFKHEALRELCLFLKINPDSGIVTYDKWRVSLIGVKNVCKNLDVLYKVLSLSIFLNRKVLVLLKSPDHYIALADSLVEHCDPVINNKCELTSYEDNLYEMFSAKEKLLLSYGILLLYPETSSSEWNSIESLFSAENTHVLISSFDAVQNVKIRADTILFFDEDNLNNRSDLCNEYTMLERIHSSELANPKRNADYIILTNQTMMNNYCNQLKYLSIKENDMKNIFPNILLSEVCTSTSSIYSLSRWFESTYFYIKRNHLFHSFKNNIPEIFKEREKDVLHEIQSEKIDKYGNNSTAALDQSEITVPNNIKNVVNKKVCTVVGESIKNITHESIEEDASHAEEDASHAVEDASHTEEDASPTEEGASAIEEISDGTLQFMNLSLSYLEEARMIEPNWERKVTPTGFGFIASYYNIHCETLNFLMENLNNMGNDITLPSMWNMICHAPQFSAFQPTDTDFACVRKFMNDPLIVKFPPIGEIGSLENISTFISIFIQIHLSHTHLLPSGSKYSLLMLLKLMNDIASALVEVSLLMRNSSMLTHSINVSQILHKGTFTVNTDILPQLHLEVDVKPKSSTCISVVTVITPNYSWIDGVHTDESEIFYMWIVNSNNFILSYKEFLIQKYHVENKLSLQVAMTLDDTGPPNVYFLKVMSKHWPGCMDSRTLDLRNLVLPREKVHLTELKFSLMKVPEKLIDEQLLQREKSAFLCPIFPMIFHNLNAGEDNMLIASPCGHHRPLAADISLLASLKQDPSRKIVYVSVYPSEVTERFDVWNEWLSNTEDYKTLSGTTSDDVHIFLDSSVVLLTSKDFENITRCPKVLECFLTGKVGLLILDCVDAMDSYMEAGMMRLKTFKGRVIAISRFTLMNADDLSQFLNIEHHRTYNFGLSSSCLRNSYPKMIEVRYVYSSLCVSMEPAMNEAIWEVLCENKWKDETALVIVHSTKDALLTARAFVKLLRKNVKPNHTEIIDEADDLYLKQFLRYRLGICHSALPPSDFHFLRELLHSSLLQVLIVTSDVLDVFTFKSPLVIVKGTEYYNRNSQQYVEISETELGNIISYCYSTCSDNGTANRRRLFILTSQADYACHKPFLNSIPVESSLFHSIPDFLNVEITAGRLRKNDLEKIFEGSYLYKRLSINPGFYQLENCSAAPKLLPRIQKSLNLLENVGCANICKMSGKCSALDLGTAAAELCISISTLEKLKLVISPAMSMEDIILAALKTNEVFQLPLRYDLENLSTSSKDGCIVNVNTATLPRYAICCLHLFEAYLGQYSLPTTAYCAINQKATVNLLRNLLEMILKISVICNYATTTLNTLLLLQMIRVGRWGDRISSFLILPHFTRSLTTTLLADSSKLLCLKQMFNKYQTLSALKKLLENLMEEDQIKEVYNCLIKLPRLKLDFRLNNMPLILKQSQGYLQCTCPLNNEKTHYLQLKLQSFHTDHSKWNFILCSETDGKIISFCKAESGSNEVRFQFTIPKMAANPFFLTLYVIADTCIGHDQQYRIKIHVDSGKCFFNRSGNRNKRL